MFKTPLDRFRFIAFVEGCSFLLIGFTMILKYRFDMPEPNYVVGMIHGVLFILYVFMLFQVSYLYKWSFMKLSLGFIASLIPFGTFYADKKLFRQQNSAGNLN
ncbi:DUF3817 domain-containing protein [Daejeonella sp. H1SJ63]|jgi:integral membrane protein|uniref:DUF3817 domain-containing protein n=1 Tax=Daejeonella sp. H1SJ63 TaxID=3034145 RepID=UPI0023EBD30A|nr:DUF3817 domain-containing protein [Daejeonella sp. H1SJ63]